MVKLVALKAHPIIGVGRKVRPGETFEVPERIAKTERFTKLAADAPDGSPDPVYTHATPYKRRDVPRSPARVDMQAERATTASPPRIVGAMGRSSGLGGPPTEETAEPPRRPRGRPRRPRTEEPADEGESE